jgi:hypothetical protein
MLLIAEKTGNDLLNRQASTRTIDGVVGGIYSGDQFTPDYRNRFTMYGAFYQPTIDPEHLMVFLTSGYPWDEGTLSLLKTVHVEKIR